MAGELATFNRIASLNTTGQEILTTISKGEDRMVYLYNEGSEIVLYAASSGASAFCRLPSGGSVTIPHNGVMWVKAASNTTDLTYWSS
jgi:hypothetical protein